MALRLRNYQDFVNGQVPEYQSIKSFNPSFTFVNNVNKESGLLI